MGDFSDIMIPSKYGARMGMNFTPSFPTIMLFPSDWHEENDEKFEQCIFSHNFFIFFALSYNN